MSENAVRRRAGHRRTGLFAYALLLASPLTAQVQPSLEQSLAPLVEEALASNFEIAGSQEQVAQRLAELDVARARYRPVLDLSARYSRADGGRTIDVPVGDLLNPVYASLEQLTANPFPRVDNVSLPFVRAREQETKLTLTQALYDPRIAPAVDAGREAHRSATAGLTALRARIVRDTKQAYYGWLSARDTVAISESALELGRANQRVNESLHRNGKITRDLVLRAEADVFTLEQRQRAALSNATLAASYVNLLRNAALDAPLPEARIDEDGPRRARQELEARSAGGALELESLTASALSNRPELKEFDAAIAASNAQERLASAAFKPSVGLAVDAGIQGEDYGVDDDDRFVLASVVVRFNAFDGGADRARVRAAHAASGQLVARREQTALAIRLETQTALEQLGVAESSLETAGKRLAAAEAAFEIASRKRDLGRLSPTEFIDARNTLTEARFNSSLTRAAALARLAEVEYAAGLARAAD